MRLEFTKTIYKHWNSHVTKTKNSPQKHGDAIIEEIKGPQDLNSSAQKTPTQASSVDIKHGFPLR